MDWQSGLGGSAAFVGTVVLGVFASGRLVRPLEAAAPVQAGASVVAESVETNRPEPSPEAEPADPLERPLDEIRTFFGYPRRAQRAPSTAERAELARANVAGELQAMAGARGYELRFLIALVPDPVSSYIGSQFDGSIAALLRGATASGWLPDRHWLPWRDSGGAESPTSERRPQGARRYWRSPGIVLFRKPDERALLAVFLVGESPLTGIHKRPFVDTLEFVSAIVPANEGIQILGPYSSGAAGSCARALEDWYSRKKAPPTRRILFTSGSATSTDVGERLKQLQCEPCRFLEVEFRRTVVSDRSLEAAGFRFFSEQLGWFRHEIAVLAESDSSYGQMVVSTGRTGESRNRFWRLFLPVPSALSSVRTASERSRRTEEEVEIAGVRVPSLGLELKLDETRLPRDTFPVFDPMTAPVNELQLESLLSILSREKIRHLGLIFTDVRDKLFVAEKVREHAPHLSMFTFESSVLYVHPRVNTYTDGMLVVSSYPLSMVTQQLLGGRTGGRRVQFGSDSEQGIYNATIIALAEPGVTPPVADYLTIPETGERAPAVWISAVGSGRLVPLAAVRPYEKRGEGQYVGRVGSVSAGRLPPELKRLVRRLGVPSGFRFFFWVASVGFIVFGFALSLAYAKSRKRATDGLAAPFRPLLRPDPLARRQQKRWTAALLAVFSAFWIALATVYVVPFVLRARSREVFEIPRAVRHGDGIALLEELVMRPLAVLLPIVGLLLVLWVARLGWMLDRNGEEKPRPVFAAILGLTAAGALVLSREALSAFRVEPYGPLDHAVFTYLRAVSGPGDLSPLAGILILAAGYQLMLVFQLQRLRIRDDWSCRMPVEALAESRDLPVRSLKRSQERLDERIRQAFPRSPSFWAPFVVLLGPLLFAFFFRFEAASDSFLWSKTFAFFFAILLLPASLAAFFRFASLWRALRRVIVRQEWSRLGPAFQSCQEELEWQSLKVWGPSKKHNYSTLIGSVELLRRLCQRPERPRVTEEVVRVGGQPSTLSQLAQRAEESLAEALEANARGEMESERAARIRALAALDDASQHVQRMLNHLDAPGAADADAEIRKELTEYVALRAIAYIRYVFAEIRNSLLAFTVGILFLLAGLASFHFQPTRSVYVLLWSVIGVVAVWTVTVFMQMDRNTVLSRIGGTTPGELNPIKSGLLLRIAAFVLPPVITLIVTQFPRLGQPLSSWLNPLFRVFQ